MERDDWQSDADFDAAQEWWDAQEEPSRPSTVPDIDSGDDQSQASTDSGVARLAAAEAHYYDTIVRPREELVAAYYPTPPPSDSSSEAAWCSAYTLNDEGEYMAACDRYEWIEESHCAYYWRYVYEFWQGADGTGFGEGALEDWSRRNRELRIGHRAVGEWARLLARWGLLPKVVA